MYEKTLTANAQKSDFQSMNIVRFQDMRAAQGVSFGDGAQVVFPPAAIAGMMAQKAEAPFQDNSQLQTFPQEAGYGDESIQGDFESVSQLKENH